jgi:hypothetical protein
VGLRSASIGSRRLRAKLGIEPPSNIGARVLESLRSHSANSISTRVPRRGSTDLPISTTLLSSSPIAMHVVESFVVGGGEVRRHDSVGKCAAASCRCVFRRRNSGAGCPSLYLCKRVSPRCGDTEVTGKCTCGDTSTARARRRSPVKRRSGNGKRTRYRLPGATGRTIPRTIAMVLPGSTNTVPTGDADNQTRRNSNRWTTSLRVSGIAHFRWLNSDRSRAQIITAFRANLLGIILFTCAPAVPVGPAILKAKAPSLSGAALGARLAWSTTMVGSYVVFALIAAIDREKQTEDANDPRSANAHKRTVFPRTRSDLQVACVNRNCGLACRTTLVTHHAGPYPSSAQLTDS